MVFASRKDRQKPGKSKAAQAKSSLGGFFNRQNQRNMATQTSIQSYHSLENEGTQILKVAAFLEKETKAGRVHSIRTIAEHFMKSSNYGLSQISTVSARLNVIKENGIVFDGRKMELKLIEVKKNPGGRKAEHYALVNEQKKQAEQLLIF